MLASEGVATAQLAPIRAARWQARARVRLTPSRSPGSARVLGIALLAALLYAAFARGASETPEGSRLAVGVALVAVPAAAAWLFGPLELRASRLAWAGIGLLAAFALWSGVSLAWSVSPDATWITFNRIALYAVATVLAVAFGSSHPRAVERAVQGGLVLAVLVSLYALGGKVVPGIHIGPLDLDQTAVASRLRAPLFYWNALALICVLGVLVALRAVVDSARSRPWRLAGLAALWLELVVLGLTYSRGGVLALVGGLAISLALGGARLRSLAYVLLALLAAAPGLAMAFTGHALTATGVPLAQRSSAGLGLGLLLLATLGALLAVGRALIGLEGRVAPDPRRSRRIGLLLGAGLLVGFATLLASVALSSRGLGGTASHVWHDFTRPRGENVNDPARLTSGTSGNRWPWWKEAAGAFSDRPAGGWGAGSFPVTHLLYRKDTLLVQQTHSFPLELLAETGIIGLLLAAGAVLTLLAAGARAVRRLGPGRDRALAACLVGGAAAWLVQALVDWNWDIPAVTLPVLVALGVLAGASARSAPREEELGSAGRAVMLAALTLACLLLAISAALPGLADQKSRDALITAGVTPRAVAGSLQQALLGSRLDPLAVAPLVSAAVLAESQGRFDRARDLLLEATARDSHSVAAWEELGRVDLQRSDAEELVRAARRLLALDPRRRDAAQITDGVRVLRAPPAGSATATGTPLP